MVRKSFRMLQEKMLTKEDFKDCEGNPIKENTFYEKSLNDEIFYMKNFKIDKSRIKGTQAYWIALDQYGYSEEFILGKQTEWLTIIEDVNGKLNSLDSRIEKLQNAKKLIQEHRQ